MSKVVSAVVGGIASIFGDSGGGNNAPAVTPPTVMPLPDDAAVAAAKKKQTAREAQISGRASTILSPSNQTDKLGG